LFCARSHYIAIKIHVYKKKKIIIKIEKLKKCYDLGQGGNVHGIIVTVATSCVWEQIQLPRSTYVIGYYRHSEQNRHFKYCSTLL